MTALCMGREGGIGSGGSRAGQCYIAPRPGSARNRWCGEKTRSRRAFPGSAASQGEERRPLKLGLGKGVELPPDMGEIFPEERLDHTGGQAFRPDDDPGNVAGNRPQAGIGAVVEEMDAAEAGVDSGA